MVAKLLNRWKTKNPTTNLPPGPRKLPLIGNMHQMTGGPPHRILRDLAKKHGPLMYLQTGEVSNIVVSSPEMAREVMITNGIVFAQRPFNIGFQIMTYNSKDIAMAPYGNYWRQLRKICTMELLNAKRVQSFRSIREEEVCALVKAIASNEGSPINITKKFVALTCDITSKAAFGSKCKDQDAYLSYMKEFLRLSSGLSLAEAYPSIKVLSLITGMKQKFEKLFQQSDKVVQGILDDHKESLMAETTCQGREEEDFVTTFLKLQKNGDLEFPLTDADIKAVIWDMFIAGTETSSTALTWAMSEIIRNPRILEKAQREVRTFVGRNKNVDEICIPELKYLEAVFKETLRFHPPLPISFPRASGEKCVINGFDIPANTRVLLNTWAIGRDPNYWSEAETFLPERFLDCSLDYKGTDLQYIPFGAGRRVCPGISFGVPSIVLALAQLLYHFDWKLPNGIKPEDLDMTEGMGVTVSRKDDLILIPATYKH